MTQSIPLSGLESNPSAKFAEIGDSHKGKIVSLDERPQTDIDTGQPLLFKDGTPRKQWVIGLMKPDGETVALYAKGGKFKAETGSGEAMLTAIGLAVRAANASGVDVGGELAIAFTGLGEKKIGKAAPKLFTAQYRPPATASIPADLFDAS
jgi:hypothetical protein